MFSTLRVSVLSHFLILLQMVQFHIPSKLSWTVVRLQDDDLMKIQPTGNIVMFLTHPTVDGWNPKQPPGMYETL